MTEKFSSLYKTHKKGDSSVLKLKCDWSSDGLNILVIDGNTAWKGKFSAEEVKTFSEVPGITRDEYIIECQQAFSGRGSTEKYSFTVENNRFVWRKELDADIKVKFASIKLSPVPLLQALQEFLDIAFETVEHCRNEVADAKKKAGYFETERTILVKKLEEYAQKKEEVENILYSKFLCILNAKKEKIATLEREISELTSKIQHSATETGNKDCDTTDVSEQSFKAEPSSKTTRQMRKSSKKPYQSTVRQSLRSVAADTELLMLSVTPSENSDTRATHSSISKKPKQKQNDRKKGQQTVKDNSVVANGTTSFKKEESYHCTSKSFVEQTCESNVLEQSASIQHQTSLKSDTEQQNTLVVSCASSVASTSKSILPSGSHAPVKNETADEFNVDEKRICTIRQPQSDKEALSLEKRAKGAIASEQINKVAQSVYGSEASSNTACKTSEVICPIDLVSQKINAPSDAALNNTNKITTSKGNKKVVTSPTKQYKDFEIISPLDMLVRPKSCTSSAGSKDPVYMPKNNALRISVKSVNMQDNSSPTFSTCGINVCQETATGGGDDFANDLNTNARINTADVSFITVPSADNTKNQYEVESNHYDSETDVDEPEESCKLSAKHRSFNGIQEDSDYSLLTVLESSQTEHDVLHQKGQNNAIDNLLNDSQDTDNTSQEIPLAALPKRVRRSDRISKSVPVKSKSINHFTELTRLQEKSQNVSHGVQSLLYEQETQLVDTQKLLDELG